MNRLRIARGLADEMIDHVKAQAPLEGCGALGGRDGEVTKVIALANAAESPVRYAIDPKDFERVQARFDGDDLEWLAVFHSHTRTPARPSPTDIRLAVGDWLHVIVSLAREDPDIRAFHISKEHWDDQTGTVEEVPVEIVD